MADFWDTVSNAGRYLLGYPPAPAPDKVSPLSLADLVAGKKAKSPVVPKPVTVYDKNGNAHQYMPAESMSAAEEPGWFSRVGNSFVDTVEHHTPAALLSRVLSGYLPATEDYVGGGDNSQAAQQARARARVVQTERDYREQQAGKEADHPANTLGKKAADFIGGAGGAILGDPTSMIAPGKTLLGRMAAQGAFSGADDSVQQGLELAEGTRDSFDPHEALWSAALGSVAPAAHAAITRLGSKVVPQSIKDRFNYAPEDAVDPGEAINSPSHFVDRAAHEGTDFINSPEGMEYFNKNARAIHQELNNRIDAGDPVEAAAQLDRRVQQADDYFGPERRDAPDVPGVDGTPIEANAAPTTRLDSPAAPIGYDPEAAAAQRERLSTLSSPPEDPRMSTAEGEPTNLTFPKGDVRDISAYNDEGLRAKLAAAGIDPVEIAGARKRESDAAINREDIRNRTEDLEDQDLIKATRKPVIGNDNTVETPEETARLDLDHAEKRALDNPSDESAYADLQEARSNFRRVTGKSATAVTKEAPIDPVVQQHAEAAAQADDDTLNNRAAHFTDEAAATGDPQDEAIRDAYRAEQQRRGGGDGEGPVDHEATVAKLTGALKNAEKLLPEQQQKYTQERRARLEAARALQQSTEGEAGLHAELSALKGELPKQDFSGVRDRFTQPEVDHLFDHIKNNTDLSQFASIRARIALGKLLDGKLPTNSEVALLGKVFGKDFVDSINKNRSLSSKIMDALSNGLNVPRSLMSSFDLSAPFRQGLFMAGRKEFWGAFKDMFKAFGSERAFKALNDEIDARPTRDLMSEAKLYLADPNHALGDREEQFMSSWAEKIPVIGRGVRASDRAYTGFLNKVRADVFDSILKNSEGAGIDIANDPKALKDLGSFVNNATGRGNLGKTLTTAGPLLNSLFFSPRLIASRVSLLNPAYYASLSPAIRKEAIRSLLHVGALATTVTGLAAAAGLDVETDPRSSDFAKIRTGNTRYDILGGFGQYITLGARLATNANKTNGVVSPLGGGFGKPTRLDVLQRFGQSKLSPVAGFVADYLRGKTYTGEPFSVRSEAANVFTPLFLQDAKSVMDEQGAVKGAAMSVPGLFGVGMNTYSPIPPAPNSIKVNHQDVPLTDEMRKDYTQRVQDYLDYNIKQLKDTGEWKKYSLDERNSLTHKILQDGRKQAKLDMFDTSPPPVSTPAPAPAPAPTPAATPGPSEDQPLFEGFEGLPRSIRRTKEGNERVGGVANSDHLTGDAVDFVPPKGMTMKQLEGNAIKFFGPDTRILNEGDHIHVHIPGFHGPLFGKIGGH